MCRGPSSPHCTAPQPRPTGSRTQPSGRLHCLEPAGVADQTCKEGGMANGTGNCWAFGGSVLSQELPFTLSPDSDPCGTSNGIWAACCGDKCCMTLASLASAGHIILSDTTTEVNAPSSCLPFQLKDASPLLPPSARLEWLSSHCPAPQTVTSFPASPVSIKA